MNAFHMFASSMESLECLASIGGSRFTTTNRFADYEDDDYDDGANDDGVDDDYV